MNGIVVGKSESGGGTGAVWEQTTQYLVSNVVDNELTIDLTQYGNAIVPNLDKDNFYVKLIAYEKKYISYIAISCLERLYNSNTYRTSVRTSNTNRITFNLNKSAKTLYLLGDSVLSQCLDILAFGFLNIS